MRKTLLFSLLVLLTLYITITGIGCTSQNSDVMNGDEDLTKYVNPFIGTAFTGHTFPGATYPLGFMQPGPETGNF
jgi:putative alpha-1,2-mannosidase